LVSTFIWNLLTTETLQSHLDNVVLPTYSKRHASLITAINSLLAPFGVTTPNASPTIAGGWFLWLHLPSWCNAKELSQKLQQQQNLIVTPGESFSLPPPPSSSSPFSSSPTSPSYPTMVESGMEHCLRICFAWEDEERLVQGIGRLKDGLERMNRDSGRGSVSGGRGLGITALIDA
ncbi:Valine--pyruvate aminotransferase, partial [Rhizina undulata]